MKKEFEKLNSANREFDFKQFWTRLWILITPIHGKIIKFVIFVVFSEAARLVGPYILKLIIDLITNFHPEDISKMAVLIVLMFIVNQGSSLMSFIGNHMTFNMLSVIESYLSKSSFQKMVSLDLGYHEKENTGSKVFKIQRGIDKLNDLIGNFSWEVIPTSIQIILTTVTLFFVDWKFGLTLTFFVPIFVFLSLKVNRDAFPVRKARHDLQEDSAGFMSQAIININTVKSYVQEKRESGTFGRMTDRIWEMVLFEYGKYMKYDLWRNLVIDLGRVSMLFFGIYLVSQNQMTVGTLVFVFTISEKSLIALYRVSRLYDKIMESGESVARIYDLSGEQPEIRNPKNGLKPRKIDGKIVFENVVFAYPESKQKALDGVSFAISSGAVTALVGPSGGGKTTVARLVYRHYDPIEGRVFLDGKNLRDYDIHGFRKFLAIVPQEVEIFSASVRENICYAKPEASFQEIEAAARIANADEFINKMGDKYDTLVGERGVKLSGGQRQRIGIARAVLADPCILIFDEATSSLDSYSERLIQEAMDKVRKGRTVIVIAHRFSTIKKADKIIVLEQGKVVEEGSHSELSLLNGGLYQKLNKLQEMGDIEKN